MGARDTSYPEEATDAAREPCLGTARADRLASDAEATRDLGNVGLVLAPFAVGAEAEL